jgi:hypothetical protein
MEEHLNRSCNFTERKHQNIHVETYQRAATAIERSGMPNMVRVSGYGFVNRTLAVETKIWIRIHHDHVRTYSMPECNLNRVTIQHTYQPS